MPFCHLLTFVPVDSHGLDLQERNTALLGENGTLMLRVVALERELAQTQQAGYDLQVS